MKKRLLFVLIFIFSLLLISCNKIREYEGKEIAKIIYQTIDYNGGYTINRVLDFEKNEYLKNGYLPVEDEDPSLELVNTFTDEEEKVFIDGCYTMGLFDLNSLYKRDGIFDGGGWTLTIFYKDGTNKVSTGSNDWPTKVFNSCSTFFFDLCGEEVLGRLPDYYYYPPGISYAFVYKFGENGTGSDNSTAEVSIANYNWNNYSSLENDIFLINENVVSKNQFLINNNYKLVLYTTNYNYKEKFKSIIIKNYDYNSELTNEKEVYNGGWFIQIEIDLELDKIYKYVLEYKDGDYAEFTFSTKSKGDKILYGEYYYSIYEEGQSILKINEDGTYELMQFDYIDKSKNKEGSIIGEYKFESIGGKEYISLDTNDGKRILLEYSTKNLRINFAYTTFDLASYNLDGVEEEGGRVDFHFWR